MLKLHFVWLEMKILQICKFYKSKSLILIYPRVVLIVWKCQLLELDLIRGSQNHHLSC